MHSKTKSILGIRVILPVLAGLLVFATAGLVTQGFTADLTGVMSKARLDESSTSAQNVCLMLANDEMVASLSYYGSDAADTDLDMLAPAPANEPSDIQGIFEAGRQPRFIDEEGLLTPAQASILTNKLDAISERHQFDVVVAVVYSLGNKDARLYAADFYELNGFGFGASNDGIILLLATENRDYAFVTTGYGKTAFTDAGQKYFEKQFLPQLKEDKYYDAFVAYANAADDFLNSAEAGKPYDTGNIPVPFSERLMGFVIAAVISFLIALLIAFSVVKSWETQLKTIHDKNAAAAYIREGNIAMTSRQDVFLYKNVEQVWVGTSDSSSSGGSNSFSSSSGTSYSGSSGKY